MVYRMLDHIQGLRPDASVLDSIDTHVSLLEAAFEKEGVILTTLSLKTDIIICGGRTVTFYNAEFDLSVFGRNNVVT